MKKKIRLLPLLAALIAASTAHAQVVYQFSADVGDPSAQGFAQSGSGSVSSIATTYLNESIWRVEDADEDNTGYQYTHDITTEEVSTLQERGYRVSARFAFLDTDYNDSQSCNVYFADGTRRFLVWIDESSTDNLVVNLTTDGEAIPINLGSADVNGFYNIDIDVEPGGTTAKLLVNGEVKYSGWGGDANTNRFLRFGNGSTGGRGAGGWNRVQIASRVPESDMIFVYDSNSGGYELDAVNDVAGHLHVPDTFDGTHGEKDVTVIGDQACSTGIVGHTDLVSLRLPSQLTSIGSSAFRNCSGFDGTLTIPDGVSSIGAYAFRGCSGFTGSLNLPASLTSIGYSAFIDCSGFDGSLTLPTTLQSIGNTAFWGCSGFSGSLFIPASVTFIGNGFAADCSSLQAIEAASDNINYASLNGVLFNKDQTTLLQFPAGHNNTTYAIPASVTTIADYAFYRCSGLTGSLTLPASLQTIGSAAFKECDKFTGSLTLPASLQTIGQEAFAHCSGLTGALTIPDGVTSIGHSAFAGCDGFDGSLTIPEGITSIGGSAFRNCSGFDGTLTLPTTLQSIGSSAFRNCSGFDEICWLGAPPTTYGTTPFLSTTATHYVPGTYLDEYQALAGLEGAQIKPGTHTTRLVIRPDGSQYRVTYLAHSGYTHQPEISPDLESWVSYSSSIIGNDQTNHFTINPAEADRRYFRVRSTLQE